MRISDWSSDVCSSDLPEKVKDVEIGFKGDFLDRRLRTNIAAFYIWRNGAQNIVNEFSNGTLTQYVRNAGDIRSYGLEFDGTALPWEGMEITTAIGYLHSRYADGRSDERRVGKECDSTCSIRWSRDK